MNTYFQTRKTWGMVYQIEVTRIPLNPDSYYLHILHQYDSKGKPYTIAQVNRNEDTGEINALGFETENDTFGKFWTFFWLEHLPDFVA